MIGRLNIRQLIEEREEYLSSLAVKSRLSRGRIRYEPPCPVRTAFQRDRDRIIHCKSFRRLKHKTQVFIAPPGDHFVTRLTHTLEVSQIARTIARALNLNEDLTEAIALGHDLGHTPFGHVGEDILNELYSGGFRHSEQSLRIVELLENDGRGLNLTWEVRDGIMNHSKSGVKDILGEGWGEANTLEGEVVKIADFVAYINHDIGDAIRAGIVVERDLPLSAITVLGLGHSQRINTMVCDIIENSWAIRGWDVTCNPKKEKPSVKMSPEVLAAAHTLNDFLFERVYNMRSAQEETERAREDVRFLYQYFNKHGDEMPAEYRLYANEDERRVVDYIAGMTDQYAMRLAAELQDS
ncbi:MAG: deoxyguanosinetriphosphate triphosphohydrolase [Chloroflexi bacterium RBG_16_50_9]|nr:MAG: deoxyguanosinetriphosphate triphosphohydrolase [Chloroflexi bacterium RBG_16_50_9]